MPETNCLVPDPRSLNQNRHASCLTWVVTLLAVVLAETPMRSEVKAQRAKKPVHAVRIHRSFSLGE